MALPSWVREIYFDLGSVLDIKTCHSLQPSYIAILFWLFRPVFFILIIIKLLWTFVFDRGENSIPAACEPPFTYVWSGFRLWELPWAFPLTFQSWRSASQVQYESHLLVANSWLGWWLRDSDLQCLEPSRRGVYICALILEWCPSINYNVLNICFFKHLSFLWSLS